MEWKIIIYVSHLINIQEDYLMASDLNEKYDYKANKIVTGEIKCKSKHHSNYSGHSSNKTKSQRLCFVR